MFVHPIVALLLVVTFIQSGLSTADAQTVSIQSKEQLGHGFIFMHGSQCYVIMPRHVSGDNRRVTVYSAAPVVHSGALVETPFWMGIDLAIGVVRGPIETRCKRTLDDLLPRTAPETGVTAQLTRLRPSGEVENIDMVVTKGSYLTLEARTKSDKQELYKGTSGALLFSDGVPIGMATKALSDNVGLFMRTEEIHMNVERRLNRRAGFAMAMPPQPRNTVPVKNSLAVSLESVTLPPTFPDYGEENLLSGGSYVFELTRPNRLAFRIKSDEAVALSRVRIFADPAADYALPKGVRIDVSSQPDGSRSRSFLVGDMGPDGLYDAVRQPSLVRWIYITVTGGWEAGPIGISGVAFE